MSGGGDAGAFGGLTGLVGVGGVGVGVLVGDPGEQLGLASEQGGGLVALHSGEMRELRLERK